ncbi:hypothetical protein [Bartonella tribocorum]|uniref:Protein-disulfide reductase n=1 Tax=Bartonella tribocorum (strain DSM 28219 / CCUG 45778 / CIP 105476 / IBS 506) TaxID=382640 RepID=A9IQT9_BART1|nr:hypothetical protein [Bartonella tribocorum]CAK01100.1 hypothetical protein BT_0666 [Bartonella tribocorum CIP 105476]CDO48312.1 hypothetical membrane protein [Bartonella tribocorum]
MVKIFKNYVLSVFIASTFFLSQTVNVNANYLKNGSPKEEFSVPLMEQVKNAKSDAVSTTAFYVPSVNYKTENGTTFEGKVEKVLEPMTVGVGLLFAGYAMSFIGSIISWIKDIVLMFK